MWYRDTCKCGLGEVNKLIWCAVQLAGVIHMRFVQVVFGLYVVAYTCLDFLCTVFFFVLLIVMFYVLRLM